MPSHDVTGVHTAPSQDRAQRVQRITVQPKRKLILLTLIALISSALAVLIVSVIAVAGTPSHQQIIDPPQWLLPGSPLIEDSPCPHRQCCTRTPLTTGDGRLVCRINLDGNDIYVTYDDTSQEIVQTVISASHYTIGDLILAWGNPTSFTQYVGAINVYWGTRYAHLFTCSFQPSNRVKLIAYDLKEHQAVGWQGFITGKGQQC